MILTRTYDLDVVPGGMPKIIRVSRNDSSSQLVFSLYAGRGKLDIPGTANAYIQGSVIKNPVLCGKSKVGDGPYKATVTLTKEMTGKRGRHPFELVIRASEGTKKYRLVTATFLLDVR